MTHEHAPRRTGHPGPDDFVLGLTPSQAQAVTHRGGPLLVLAGPGSGKTRVITRRIAHLVATGVRPWQIVALTFTNKAAGEMRQRVAELLDPHNAAPDSRARATLSPALRGLTITTFHALCVRLLRRYAEASGLAQRGLLSPDFALYDADDQARLVKSVVAQLQLSASNFPPRTVLASISAAKNDLLSPAQYQSLATDFFARSIARCYTAYQAALRHAGAADFDDLLLLTAEMLRDCQPVRDELRARFRHVLVDEYQDTNRAQFVIASLLAGPAQPNSAATPTEPTPTAPPNICVVGDPDQSIYAWRGADISNILNFERNYPGARVIALGENFRSRAPILATADRLIRRNTRRKHKPLIPTRGPGQPVRVTLCRDEHHEAATALAWFQGSMTELPDARWKDCAVLFRTNALSRVIEDTLRNAGVPYVMVRGTAFYDRQEVRHALAYLRVLASPADAVSLERVINTPARGISDATLERLRDAVATGALPDLRAALARPDSVPGIAPRAAAAVAKFHDLLGSWRTLLDQPPDQSPPAPTQAPAPNAPAASPSPSDPDQLHSLFATHPDIPASPDTAPDAPPDAPPTPHDDQAPQPEPAGPLTLAALVERVIRQSGLEHMYRAEEERLENLAELVSSAAEFEQQYRAGLIDPDVNPAALSAAPAPESPTPSPAAPDPFADPFGDPFADHPPASALAPAPEPSDMLAMLRAYLERVALVADTDALDPQRGAVTLMTLHAAKGLEFPLVAMIGLEEGSLPHVRSQDSEPALEEERRLAFVGITRAMERLLITGAAFRTLRGTPERTIPSRFIDEIRGPDVVIADAADPLGHSHDPDMARFLRGARDPAPSDSHAAHPPRLSSYPGPHPHPRPAKAPAFAPGTRVRHPQFGVGTVEACTPGLSARVTVRFPGVGTKTLVLEYARLLPA